MPLPDTPVILLVGGPEPLLAAAVAEVLAGLGAAEEIALTETAAAELRDGTQLDLTTPSLFGGRRVIHVRDANDLPPALAGMLKDALTGPPLEATVVLSTASAGRIQGLARAAKKAGARIDVAAPREWESKRWTGIVRDQFAGLGHRVEPAAAALLLDRAGLDVTRIVERVRQVSAVVAPGAPVTEQDVERIVRGVGSRGAFAVADAMCERRPDEAVRLLRGAFAAGEDPLKVLGAIVYRMRSLLAVAGGLSGKEAGVGMSPAQASRLRGTARRFAPGELGHAVRRLADVDAEVKGGNLPPGFLLERAVVEIATRR